jgi:glycosyltransferase involved in cell wall biosynthesis
MALANGKKYIIICQHPPNFLYDRTWAWVNNFPRFVSYVAGGILGPILRKWDKEAMLGADTIYVNSEYTKKRIDKIYNHPNVKIMYPPIGEQFKVYPKEKQSKFKSILLRKGIKNDFILLHGRQIKDKHPEWAIESFSKIKDTSIKLVISGTIEEEKKILDLINDLDIKNRVHILGRVNETELLALYNRAKCFIMAAPKEDFGLTTCEALACGCPAVGWADGAGTSEILGWDSDLLAKPYSIDNMARKIDAILKKDYSRLVVSKSVDKFKAKTIKKQFLDAVNELVLDYRYDKNIINST